MPQPATEARPELTLSPLGQKILIVDDNVVILKVLGNKLKAAGYQVATATDGAEAIREVRRQRPDLVILDINFPPDVAHGGGVHWDGYTIMEWLRRMEGLQVPIITITSDPPEKQRAKSLAAGAVAFFHKPVNPEELIATIRSIFGEAQPPPLTPG